MAAFTKQEFRNFVLANDLIVKVDKVGPPFLFELRLENNNYLLVVRCTKSLALEFLDNSPTRECNWKRIDFDRIDYVSFLRKSDGQTFEATNVRGNR